MRPVPAAVPSGGGCPGRTGMLLADLVNNRVVQPDEKVGDLLPGLRFTDPAVRSATLEQLASNRAGLPYAPRPADVARVNKIIGRLSARPDGQAQTRRI